MESQNKKKIVLTIIVLVVAIVAMENYAWARIDLDFMVNQYKWSAWHREQEVWHFTPDFTMPWWDAYILTVIRLVLSVAVISVCYCIFFFPMNSR